jgi:glycosyltransferase involved in cell wall biosynthesis
MEIPFVSVCMITYNHEKYISEAIEGVITQKTNFRFELIIGEDCSTDNTRYIVKEYESKYPEIIVGQYPSQNRGLYKNFLTVLQSARGKYIALCEGDDYWTDPYKLQKQVDFLEANPEYSMCFHNAIKIYENNFKKPELFNDIFISREVAEVEIINNWIIPTASIIFRRNILPLPDWSKNVYSGDMTLALIAMSKGKIFCFNSIMSIYRINFSGSSMTAMVSGKFDFVLKEHIKLYNYFLSDPLCKDKKIIEDKIKLLRMELKFQQLKHKCYIYAFIKMPSYFLKKIKEQNQEQ